MNMMTNTFVNAVINQEARTQNGMKARKSTGSAIVDLYYNIGASRGKDILPAFAAAFVENKDLAIRVALWARDVRGGAGERKVFRDILVHLCDRDPDLATRILAKVPELGRWDDLLVLKGEPRLVAFEMIRSGLMNPQVSGLVAKWMPRKGEVAVELRQFLGMSPKQYRKTLVNLTKVVETKMCAKKWDEIDYNSVPSLAAARYKKAFNRHSVKFAEYVEKLAKGEAGVKVNAGAVYPYDILKGRCNTYFRTSMDANELKHVEAQWNALPNFVGDANILPLVDVSGSMLHLAGGLGSKSGVSCLDVAISLGLYLADKNEGKFKDTFLTFTSTPELLHLTGSIRDKVIQMARSNWQCSTNLHSAFEKILDVAVKGSVPQEEMPSAILILSDMQFNGCCQYDDSAIEMIARKYEAAGYSIPNVVFWNLNASYGNQPVEATRKGVALVSGFSPSLVQNLGKFADYTPEKMMLDTIMNVRYNY
jgi:hypothetical protein